MRYGCVGDVGTVGFVAFGGVLAYHVGEVKGRSYKTKKQVLASTYEGPYPLGFYHMRYLYSRSRSTENTLPRFGIAGEATFETMFSGCSALISPGASGHGTGGAEGAGRGHGTASWLCFLATSCASFFTFGSIVGAAVAANKGFGTARDVADEKPSSFLIFVAFAGTFKVTFFPFWGFAGAFRDGFFLTVEPRLADGADSETGFFAVVVVCRAAGWEAEAVEGIDTPTGTSVPDDLCWCATVSPMDRLPPRALVCDSCIVADPGGSFIDMSVDDCELSFPATFLIGSGTGFSSSCKAVI